MGKMGSAEIKLRIQNLQSEKVFDLELNADRASLTPPGRTKEEKASAKKKEAELAKIEADLAENADVPNPQRYPHIGMELLLNGHKIVQETCKDEDAAPECSHIVLRRDSQPKYVRPKIEDRQKLTSWEPPENKGEEHFRLDDKWKDKFEASWQYREGVLTNIDTWGNIYSANSHNWLIECMHGYTFVAWPYWQPQQNIFFTGSWDWVHCVLSAVHWRLVNQFSCINIIDVYQNSLNLLDDWQPSFCVWIWHKGTQGHTL